MPLINVDGISYYYELHGKGRPLVFIAGFGADHTVWREVYPRFRDRYRILLFDNPATGRTRDSGGPLTAELMADGAAGLINTLGLKKPHIVGQSMGGTIAQMLAINYPEIIDRLVIVNSVHRWSGRMLMAERGIICAIKHGASLDCQLEIIMPWLFGNGALSDEDRKAALKKMLLDNPNPPPVEDLERQYNALTEFDSSGSLYKINAPTLVIISEDDIIALPGESETLAGKIAGARIARLPGGHVSGYEEPEKLAAAILQFLK